MILCESLTVREAPGVFSEEDVAFPSGTEFVTTEQRDGWMNIMRFNDGSNPGWVRAEYVLVDPAYYVTEEETPAYAYEGEDSPRVALLEEGERLPIIRETDGAFTVGLRGAAAIIRK